MCRKLTVTELTALVAERSTTGQMFVRLTMVVEITIAQKSVVAPDLVVPGCYLLVIW